MATKNKSNCEAYDQCLGFEDDSTVTALGIGVLICVIFLFLASLWHKRSNLEHLLFITSKYYLYFYFVCIVNFIVIIVSVTFLNYTVYYSQISVGATLILTSVSTMLINIIGCKYYRSYLCMKKLSLRLLLFIGLSTLIIATILGCLLLYLTIFDGRFKIGFEWFLLFVLLVTIIHTSIASFASKLAQVEWILLIGFTVFYVESFLNTVYEPFNLFLIYWHPILLCFISVASLFGLSSFIQLRHIGSNIFSCFVSVFDLVTDINMIYVWLSYGHYIWASLQTMFILLGVTFSGYYVKDYYGFVKFDGNGNENENENDNDHDRIQSYAESIAQSYAEYIPSKKLQRIGRVLTFVGLGRLWHGFLGWDSESHKDMMVSNKILKIWEMLFRCMPALILQFYIILLLDNESNYDISVLLSIAASSLSVSFTLLRILYYDHHSMTRKEDLTLQRLQTAKSNDSLEFDFGLHHETDVDLFKHPNVVAILMRGYSPSEIDNAWFAIKQSDRYKYVTIDHPQFQDIVLDALQKQSVPGWSPRSEDRNVPSVPSMNAPKPAPMISVTINGQQQQSTQMVSINVNGGQCQYQRPQIPLQIPTNVPALPQEQKSGPHHVQDSFHSDHNFEIESLAMSSEVSYKQKKNRINWTHPYIIHLKDLGWSKAQIRQAYFLMKNSADPQRAKIKIDSKMFLAFMIHILVKDLKLKPENEQREFGSNTECIDKMYQNFVCCLCCRICTKINESNACFCCCCTMVGILSQSKDGQQSNQKNFTVQDQLFYFGMYLCAVTDFYCRIYPSLAYTVLLHTYLESLTKYALLNVFIGVFPMAIILGLYELVTYRLMLKPAYKSVKNALKYFWTGYFTMSYYVLSAMHLTYLPPNVSFVRLYRAHIIRMCLEIFLICVVIGMQYTLFGHPLGFFARSVFIFAFCWVLNIWIMIWMRCYMATFERKIDM